MMKKYRSLTVILAGVSMLAVLGCNTPDTKKADEATTSEPAKAIEVKKDGEAPMGADAKKAEAPKAEKTSYTINTAEAGELTVGADGELSVVVKPAAGFKINEEFPWKLTLTGDDVVTPGEAEMKKDKWELSKATAQLKVPVKGKAAGDGVVKGKMTFSVCDEATCEVIRDKEVSWKVATK